MKKKKEEMEIVYILVLLCFASDERLRSRIDAWCRYVDGQLGDSRI